MTAWDDGALHSPVRGTVLRHETAHSLTDGIERWPVIEGIPFVRADRRALADATLAALDAGLVEDALVLLLADQDNWARTPPPSEVDRRHLVRATAHTSFRAAMDLLAFGPVGTYFAHRWSDPTFLSGLALAEAHGLRGPVFELACGAGHFLREFARAVPQVAGGDIPLVAGGDIPLVAGGDIPPVAGGDIPLVAGGDIVFAKLWLARRYLAPAARLVCFDAAEAWPFADGAFGTLFCHDAFYFLPSKPHVAREMRRIAPRLLVGHAHNALVDNLSAGSPLPPEGYAALFDAPHLYDDRELTAALVEARAPRPATAGALAKAPAVSLASGAGDPAAVTGGLALPRPGAALRRNPLYDGVHRRFPSERYATEYGPLATYPATATGPEIATAGADAAIDALARRRVLLDLPASW